MGADEDVDRSVGQAHQHRFPRPALLAAGEDGDVDADRLALALKRREMLPGEDFGRREHRRLRAGLDRFQHGQQRDQRLARADVALKQAQHRLVLRHVAADLADHPLLRARQAVGQLQLAGQPAVALQRHAALPPRDLAKQHQGELVGKNLVISQALARVTCARI